MSEVATKTDVLNQLFDTADVKAFVKLFKECETTFADPGAFLEATAEWLAPRVYERYYDDNVPHTLFGVAAAASILPVLAEDRRWWPVAQQAWHIAGQRRRAAYRLPEAAPSGTLQERWEGFHSAAAAGDFDRAFGLARGFLDNESDATFLKRRILRESLGDTSFQEGTKFLHLAQAWNYTEALEGRHAEKILFPAFHLYVHGPRGGASGEASQAGARLAAQQGVLTADGQQGFEEAVLFGADRTVALGALDAAAASGAGIDGAWEALRIAAFQAVSNAKPGKWRGSIRACLVTGLAHKASADWEPEERLEALRQVTALVHRVSADSRESTSNRDLEEVARAFVPIDTVNTLKSVVSHSDPIASATATVALLSMDESKQSELCETLASLAAKNDGRMAGGYDLLAVEAAVDAFRSFSSPAKDRPLVCCAFFLGRVPKAYELFGAYGIK